MSTINLDKSLDDIIGAKPKTSLRARRGPRKSGSGGVAKGGAQKKDVSKLKEGESSNKQQKKKKKAASSTLSQDDPFSQATKITVSNFPSDISEKKLKEYLGKEIGFVKTCQGIYGKNGAPTGKFTVEFREEGKALAAFKKLNGIAMDGGAKILQVEIHTDPTKKSLASRIGVKPSEQAKPKQKAAAKPAEAKSKKRSNNRPKRTAKVATKTMEELDAEMDDYNKQNDAITV